MPSTPLDYGQRSPRARGVQITTPIMAGLAALVAIGVTVWVVRDQARQIRVATKEIAASEIVGPACPPVVRGAFKSPLRPINTFDFNGLTFGHRFGDAECGVTAGKRGLFGTGYVNLCQFSSPAVLSVTSGKGTFYWEPGVRQEATVFVDHGQPRCVMSSPYFARWKQRVTS
jgi:hypothetical protein